MSSSFGRSVGRRRCTAAAALVAALLGACSATPTAPTGAEHPAWPDPLHVDAPTGPARPCSSLAERPAPADPSRQDWLDANRAVRAAGGWRRYAREPAPPPSVPRPCPSPGGPT